jgi:hypothetical protein
MLMTPRHFHFDFHYAIIFSTLTLPMIAIISAGRFATR